MKALGKPLRSVEEIFEEKQKMLERAFQGGNLDNSILKLMQEARREPVQALIEAADFVGEHKHLYQKGCRWCKLETKLRRSAGEIE